MKLFCREYHPPKDATSLVIEKDGNISAFFPHHENEDDKAEWNELIVLSLLLLSREEGFLESLIEYISSLVEDKDE